MKTKNKPNRFILKYHDTVIGEAPSIKELAPLVGCTYALIYRNLDWETMTFGYKYKTYNILDKLSINEK